MAGGTDSPLRDQAGSQHFPLVPPLPSAVLVRCEDKRGGPVVDWQTIFVSVW